MIILIYGIYKIYNVECYRLCLINKDGDSKEMKGKGRHDPCVVPRAVPIVESMAALVILDNMLINNSNNI